MADDWSTMPTRSRQRSSASAGSAPSTRHLSGVALPVALEDLDVVVLPAPFGPSRPNTSPSAISKLTPRTASRPSYDFRRSLDRYRCH